MRSFGYLNLILVILYNNDSFLYKKIFYIIEIKVYIGLEKFMFKELK